MSAANEDSNTTAVFLVETSQQAVWTSTGQSFAASQALAFAASKSTGIASLATTIALALYVGSPDVLSTYSMAFAQAAAAGGDQAAGLAVATAFVFCKGGATAEVACRVQQHLEFKMTCFESNMLLHLCVTVQSVRALLS